MDYSHIISAIFHDKPEVIYENPPPPDDDFEFDDFESVFFTYPRPQSVKLNPEMRFITIDRSLIHKSLLGNEEKEEGEICNEFTREEENRTDKISKKNLEQDVILEIMEKKCKISQKDESAVVSEKKKDGKHKNRSKEKKNDIDSDNFKKSKKKKALVSKSSALQSISKSYSMSESDSDNGEKHRSKSSSHHAKSHSKKSSRYRRKDKDSRNDASYSDVIPYDKVGTRNSEFAVKREVISSDEERFYSSFTKKSIITIKEELSDKDDYRKDKIKSSKSSKKKYNDSRNQFDESRSHEDARVITGKDEELFNEDNCRDNRIKSSKSFKEKYDSRAHEDVRDLDDTRNLDKESFSSSRSKKAEITVKEEIVLDKDDYRKDKIKSSKSSKKRYDDSKSRDDSRNRYVDSWSNDDTRNYDNSRSHDDSRKNHSDYSSDDDSKKRRYDDSNDGSKIYHSDDPMQREIKQEIKQEPGSSSCYKPNDYYCDVCKLILNSESTFSSHMAGKRHKKALRQLSEQDVARSTVLEITESQSFPRAPDRDRIEIPEDSKLQGTCEGANLLIVGLDYVQEIRGYEDTKYFCDLCDAQCVANSIIKHLIGFKHQMNCLKTYYPEIYNRVKDLEKRDRRLERELTTYLESAKRRNGIGKIRVFKDVKRKQRSPEPYNPYQPSTSRQTPLSGDVQGRRADEPKVTDEDCLSRDFSDFYCKVCKSHMNNYSMWESHARGKRHAKNKKKAEEGAETNSNFIEAPPGTISHLEEMIHDMCDPNDIIVGLNFIQENQGENGDLFNCFLCGSVSPTNDIIDHLYLKKHKTKYLEKMLADGYQNAINEINCLHIFESAREGLVNEECEKLMIELGHGKPVVCIPKKTF